MQQAIFRSVDELDAVVGKHVARSDWLTITQLMIDEFGDITKDEQWIHVNPERARAESPFGTTIAHGFLVVSLLTPLIHECIELPAVRMRINYGFDRIRFVSPVRVGSEIRGDFTLHEVKHLPDAVQITWSVSVGVRDAEKPAMTALWLTRLVP